MSSAIDLCQVADVRAWLNMNPETDGVATTVATSISAGTDVSVSPVSVKGMSVGSVLQVDTGANREFVMPKNVDEAATTFVADFAKSHTGPVTIVDVTSQVIGRLITSHSVAFMRKTGRLNEDGSIPTTSTLVEPVTFDQWYDGNGSHELFLKQWPITAVSAVTIGSVSVTESTSPAYPGWVISGHRKSIVLRSSTCGLGTGLRRGLFTGYSTWSFVRGVQNIRVQYTAGFSDVPSDIEDALIEWVSQDYRRRNWVDLESNTQHETMGMQRFHKWEYTPKVLAVVEDYKRRWA